MYIYVYIYKDRHARLHNTLLLPLAGTCRHVGRVLGHLLFRGARPQHHVQHYHEPRDAGVLRQQILLLHAELRPSES